LIARIPAGRSGADLYGDTPTTLQQERHLHTVAELQTRLTLSFVVTPHTLDQTRKPRPGTRIRTRLPHAHDHRPGEQAILTSQQRKDCDDSRL
jgi:hypothetical protein